MKSGSTGSLGWHMPWHGGRYSRSRCLHNTWTHTSGKKRCRQGCPLDVVRKNDAVATSGLAHAEGAVDYGPGGGSDSILMSTAPTATRWA